MFKKIKKLSSHILIYGLGNSGIRLVSFLLIPVYTRFLSPEDYGILALVGMLDQILFILMNMGQSSALFRTYFAHDRPEEREAVITTSLWLILTLSFPIGLLALVMARPLTLVLTGSASYTSWVMLGIGGVVLKTLLRMPFAVLRAREESHRYARFAFTQTAVSLVLGILFVVGLHLGGRGILLSQLMAEFLLAAYLVPAMLRGLKLTFSGRDARDLLGYGLYLIPTGFLNFLLHLSDRYFLKHFSSLQAVGIYALGYRFGEILFFAQQAFVLAWPQFLFENQKSPEAPALYARVFTYFLAVMAFLWLAVSLLAEELVQIMAAPSFHEAYRVVPWIAGAFLFQALAPVGNVGMALHRKVKYRPMVLGAATLFNLGLNYWLVPRYGSMGAAVASFASLLLKSILEILVGNRLYAVPYEYSRIGRIVLVGLTLYSIGSLITWSSIWTALIGKVSLLLCSPLLLYASGFFEPGEVERLRGGSGAYTGGRVISSRPAAWANNQEMTPRMALFCRAMRHGIAWACQRRRSLLVVGLLALALNAGTSGLLGRPDPGIHDEFSYLLAADTFAHGRLTNPTHPLWVHFESFHIFHQPTYQSKYPPAQGLILAAGQVLGGHPMVGLWISLALACVAVCWTLQGWLPARWAFLGGVLAALHPRILVWWGQSYWGGAVAMLGGALVYGALPRLRRRPRARHALLMGVGLAILANSRPYEGLVASLPAMAVLGAWIVGKNGPLLRIAIGRVVLPILAVLVVTAGGMSYYNFRVTGNPLRLPYQTYRTTYGPNRVSPHQEFRKSHASYPVRLPKKLERQLTFYFPVMLAVPLVMLPWMVRRRGIPLALVTCGMVIAASVSVSRAWPHYTAPMTGLVFLLVAHGMRHLYHWHRFGIPVLRPLVWAIPIVCVGWLIVFLAQEEPMMFRQERARLLEMLERDENRHLVIIRYRPDHLVRCEWVYNRADIDGAKVVWAREMDPEHNRELLDYYQDRRIWLLEPDAEQPILRPYPSQNGHAEQIDWGRDDPSGLTQAWGCVGRSGNGLNGGPSVRPFVIHTEAQLQ